MADAMKLVPVEPTEAMLRAGANPQYPCDARDVWSAMLAASPPAREEAPGEGAGEYLRPEVQAFAQLMEEKLRANDWKGGWKSDFSGDLLRRAHEELGELDDEMASGDPAMFDNSAVANEAADVANMLMMVVDVCGALPALRNRTSEPEAGGSAGCAELEVGRAVYERIEKLIDATSGAEAVELCYLAHLVESVEEVGGYDGPHPDHPAPATADKLRAETERLVTFAQALCMAADHYGVKHLDSDDMDDEAVQLQAATISMRHVLADALAALNEQPQ